MTSTEAAGKKQGQVYQNSSWRYRFIDPQVTPVNLPERVFVLIFMFFALSAFAICISMITQASVCSRTHSSGFQKGMYIVVYSIEDILLLLL